VRLVLKRFMARVRRKSEKRGVLGARRHWPLPEVALHEPSGPARKAPLEGKQPSRARTPSPKVQDAPIRRSARPGSGRNDAHNARRRRPPLASPTAGSAAHRTRVPTRDRDGLPAPEPARSGRPLPHHQPLPNRCSTLQHSSIIPLSVPPADERSRSDESVVPVVVRAADSRSDCSSWPKARGCRAQADVVLARRSVRWSRVSTDAQRRLSSRLPRVAVIGSAEFAGLVRLVQADRARAAAAIFSFPVVVSCSMMRTNLGCSSPETRKVHR
jgi:hypothetical protein